MNDTAKTTTTLSKDEAEAIAAASAKSILDLAIEATPESGFLFRPRSYDDVRAFATTIANSDLAPKDYKGKVDNCIIAMQLGAELGLKPMQSIQNIAVINGRPSVWGDAMLALVQASGKLEDFKETPIVDDRGAVVGYTCAVIRKGMPSPTIQTFDLARATTAHLWGKAGPWTEYPSRMFQMRARGFALRDAFADVLKGLITIEEAMDIEDVAALPVRATTDAPIQMPRRASEAVAPAPATATPEQMKPAPPPAIGEAVVVENVTEKSGKTEKGKPWTLYLIRVGGGREFSTFDKAKADAARDAIEEGAVMLVTFHEVTGKKTPLLDSIMRAPEDHDHASEPGA